MFRLFPILGFLMARPPLLGQGLIIEASRSQMHHTR